MLTPRYNQVSISEDSRTPYGGSKNLGGFPGSRYFLRKKNTLYLQQLGLSDWKKLSQEVLESVVEFLLTWGLLCQSSPAWAGTALPQVGSGSVPATSPRPGHQSCSGKKPQKTQTNKTPIKIINTASGKLLHLAKNQKLKKISLQKHFMAWVLPLSLSEQLLQNSPCFARIHQHSCPLICRASD